MLCLQIQHNSFVEFVFHICLDYKKESIDPLPIANHINKCQRQNETTSLIFSFYFLYKEELSSKKKKWNSKH